MIFETLYRTDPRGKSFDADDLTSLSQTEYFQPHIDLEFLGGRQVFFVREKHGFFDDARKKLANATDTLAPVEGFATLEEAWAGYEAQLRVRASGGFVFAFGFSMDVEGNRTVQMRMLDPKAASLLP